MAVGILALCDVVFATSTRNIGPLAEIDEVSVDAMIGDSLGIETDRGTLLFDSDRKAAADLKAALIEAASARLREAGIRVAKRADGGVTFNVFGGKFKLGGDDGKNFFMLQIMVCPPNESQCDQERTILGVVDDEGLSRTVIAAGLSALDEFIDERAAYRQSKTR